MYETEKKDLNNVPSSLTVVQDSVVSGQELLPGFLQEGPVAPAAPGVQSVALVAEVGSVACPQLGSEDLPHSMVEDQALEAVRVSVPVRDLVNRQDSIHQPGVKGSCLAGQ